MATWVLIIVALGGMYDPPITYSILFYGGHGQILCEQAKAKLEAIPGSRNQRIICQRTL